MIGNGLDDALGRNHDEDEAKKIQPRYVRNEKGQFLSNRPAAPFGVPHYLEVEKSFAAKIGQGAGSKLYRTGSKMATNARLRDAKRIGSSPRQSDRIRYTGGLYIRDAGEAMMKKPETTGYGILAGGAAAGAGGAASVHNRKKKP